MYIKTLILMISFLCGAFTLHVHAAPTVLTNYRQLVQAVETGNNVRAIIHFDKCQLTNPSLQSQIAQNLDGSSTRINFTQYLHFKDRIDGQLKDIVTSSMDTLLELPTGVFSLIYARLTVYDDDTALMHVNNIDPITHHTLFVADWLCDISNGRDDKGLYLYNIQ